MKKRYAVTKKLKKLLEWCSPNKYMKEIKQRKFFNELSKNQVLPKGIMEVE